MLVNKNIKDLILLYNEILYDIAYRKEMIRSKNCYT